MRKFLIPILLTSTFALAAPAAAQWAPPAPQGYAYGYNNNYGQVRRLQVRIDRLQRQINRLDSRNMLDDREAHRLRQQSRQLEHRLVHASRFGLNRNERFMIEQRIARLEQRVRRDAYDGNRRFGYNDYNRYDRDRDGRDDRWDRRHDNWHDRNEDNHDDDHDDD